MEYKGFGLGCMSLSTVNQAESTAVIHTALNEGVSFLNTGDFYGSGESEMAIGEALKGYNRDKFYISVKFGALTSPNGKLYGLDVHPDRIKNYLMHSLKRLKLDYIDITQYPHVFNALQYKHLPFFQEQKYLPRIYAKQILEYQIKLWQDEKNQTWRSYDDRYDKWIKIIQDFIKTI